jgi:hypothetical protein
VWRDRDPPPPPPSSPSASPAGSTRHWRHESERGGRPSCTPPTVRARRREEAAVRAETKAEVQGNKAEAEDRAEVVAGDQLLPPAGGGEEEEGQGGGETDLPQSHAAELDGHGGGDTLIGTRRAPRTEAARAGQVSSEGRGGVT